MSKIITTVFFCMLFGAFSNTAFSQDCTSVVKEYDNLISVFIQKGYKVNKNYVANFVSGTENKDILSLTAGKEYLILLVTQKLIDQSSITLLNSFGLIVVSNFKETGDDRHLVMVKYRPQTTSNYTATLKVIDFQGRTVCGYWVVLEKQ